MARYLRIGSCQECPFHFARVERPYDHNYDSYISNCNHVDGPGEMGGRRTGRQYEPPNTCPLPDEESITQNTDD